MPVEFPLPPHPPYLSDVGVISLVPDVWGRAWRRRHQILTRLAWYFDVVWCNPAPSWRKFGRCTAPPNQDVNHGSAFVPGFTIYQPERWLPSVGRPAFLSHLTMRLRLRRAQRALLARGCRKTILYLCRPVYSAAVDLIDHNLSCYHIDDEYTFSEVERPIDEREARLISRVDQVFIHSPALWEKKGKLNPRTAFIPNGVDYRAYATPCSEPADLKQIPHPRIGYVGVIKAQLDMSLLMTLAQRHPDWSFVFVGPQGNLGKDTTCIHRLLRLPNVYWLGSKPVSTLPAYTQHLDVCLLCYKVNDYTKYIFPLKLNEYLASGRPAVGSPIRSLLDFAHLIKLARTPDEWSQALKESLAPESNSGARVRARQAAAHRYDWSRLAYLTAHHLCEGLGPSYLERLRETAHGTKYSESPMVVDDSLLSSFSTSSDYEDEE